MSDRHDSIVTFVKEVEKHPCIYNQTLPEYSNRTETKRAWEEIAKNLQCKESDCREKWRKIRIAFTRSLKQMKSGATGIRPYYLYDHLTFILPFCKTIDEQITQPVSPEESEEEHEDVIYLKTDLEDYSDNLHNSETSDTPMKTVRRHEKYICEDDHKGILKRRRTEHLEDNPRKMFLLSILPDIEAFTDEEMRVFRRKIVTCIDTIMEDRVKQECPPYPF
ncbi:uncharacterized protein LOC126377906 [Pectinophora gossypiella]|uniref:uncharacterized protein LOC126377906 n=1 Tax=Pectinophora gossypiella TaxID=13191 RepID=UPI00214E1632|nr:uncharacterized protein LOC126377906 [Pectinophora gossypiella]